MLKFKGEDSTHRPAKMENTRYHCRQQDRDCGCLCCHRRVQESVVIKVQGGNTQGDNWLCAKSSYFLLLMTFITHREVSSVL